MKTQKKTQKKTKSKNPKTKQKEKRKKLTPFPLSINIFRNQQFHVRVKNVYKVILIG